MTMASRPKIAQPSWVIAVRQKLTQRPWWVLALAALTVLASAVLSFRPSALWIVAVPAIVALIILMKRPVLGLFTLIALALLVKIPISTGTEVSLNFAALFTPILFGIWFLMQLNRRDVRLAPSSTNLPLTLFLISALLSLFIGSVTWDATVPRSDKFIIVQFAQWAIFAFSAAAYWLTGRLITSMTWLRRLTAWYLIAAGILAIIRVTPFGDEQLYKSVTGAIDRAPFWALLSAIVAGQLLFNRELSTRWRIYLVAVMGAIVAYTFAQNQDRTSNWVCVAAVMGVLIWLKLPRWRWIAVSVAIVLVSSGLLFQVIYKFAGGDDKWSESGASRGVLIGRVLEVSMRNPITGIGPAAYRPYGMMKPLQYGRALWTDPRINSHNQYVDIFSQTGIVGMIFFLWFMVELLRLGWNLWGHYHEGFAGGYVAGMIGAWVSIMIIMALADWFLPFVYNIGFGGYQASALLWMFFGGLLSLDAMRRAQTESPMALP
jgi:hypothetical protein